MVIVMVMVMVLVIVLVMVMLLVMVLLLVVVVSPGPGYLIPEEELRAHKQKTYFHLRISEVAAPHPVHSTACTLHPAPCTLHPAPCNLHPAPCNAGGEGAQQLCLPPGDDPPHGAEGPGRSYRPKWSQL